MTSSRALVATVRALALAIAAAAVLAPLGHLLVASLRIHEVVLGDGTALRVAGNVVREDGGLRFQVAPRDDPDGELTPVSLRAAQVSERDRWSFAHYGDVFRSARTPGLLRNSLALATGSALLALLLGVPAGWFVARTAFAGRRLLIVLLASPLVLPPFFAAMGVSTILGSVLAGLGVGPGSLQLANGIACLGSLLAPIPALLVGRAFAAVPAGIVEAATIAGGRRAAVSGVVWPSVRPAALAAATLVFVIALCDFAVPDLLGVFLPKDAVPAHVFATEIFLQWNKVGNVGRAVATGAPFVVFVLLLVLLAASWLRRSPAGTIGGATRSRPRIPLHGARAVLPWVVALPVLALGLVLPVVGVGSWGFDPFRVAKTVRETAGLVEDTTRWLRMGLLAATVTTFVAVVLARAALRGGRPWRSISGAAIALPVAVPGMALMVGSLIAWVWARPPANSLGLATLVLCGRFLPYAIAAAGLALRDVGRGLEEPACLAGAGPATLATRIWGPLGARGIATAFLLVLVLAWRELDALVLITPGILPVRIYDKVHFGRTGAVADLSMAYLGLLLLPALLAALLWPRRRREPEGRA